MVFVKKIPLKTEIPVTPIIPQPEKKIKKLRLKPIWDSKNELIDVQYPQEIHNEKFKKRFKLNITYRDQNKKLHKKTIRFGNKTQKEFIDDGDNVKKNRISGKLGNTHNLFHANFWRLHLLNGDNKNLKDNYLNIISKIN